RCRRRREGGACGSPCCLAASGVARSAIGRNSAWQGGRLRALPDYAIVRAVLRMVGLRDEQATIGIADGDRAGRPGGACGRARRRAGAGTATTTDGGGPLPQRGIKIRRLDSGRAAVLAAIDWAGLPSRRRAATDAGRRKLQDVRG